MLAIPVSFSVGGMCNFAKNINLCCTRGIYNDLNRGFPFVSEHLLTLNKIFVFAG